jgi:hypothetical protein
VTDVMTCMITQQLRIDDNELVRTEQVGIAVTLKTCFRYMFGSNLGRDTGYPA